MDSPHTKLNQIKPLLVAEEQEKESKDAIPPSELKLLQLKSKNHSTFSKKKNQRVSFNDQHNQVIYVDNWKSLNMENSVAKGGSHCCMII